MAHPQKGDKVNELSRCTRRARRTDKTSTRTPRGRSRAFVAGGLCALVSLLAPAGALAHEPIFGVGPHTVYVNGVAVEVEGEFEGDGARSVYEVAWGLTPDLTVTAQLPFRHRRDRDASLFGDAGVRVKWRFWRRDSPGAQDALAVVGGFRLPTGSEAEEATPGERSTAFLSGLTYGHEGRRWYWFGDARYQLATGDDGLNPGDVFFYDAAFGVRPARLTYRQPDLVVLVEVNGRHIGTARTGGLDLPNTGGEVVTMGPGILLSYRNYMFKAGVAVPVWRSLRGTQPNPGVQTIVGFEVHL